ncbi:hypothetical protein BN946_scf185015.g162 [Trametes cinnabarina]|uniref:Probable methionine--tRNA ligase, mitochondrial n=1 Tax=Pycnoporus cinnabarinus TaxID=5643 RepID=A0A060SN51_PYCCI|nr:hypothetical protein BN946_scf185015.g162 [Trametes cinnabarina]
MAFIFKAPHIGHLHSLVVADIYARYAKLSKPDRPVYFVNGTDEHGLKIQNAAKAQGMDPSEFCDQLSVHFRKELNARNLIYKGRHEGWYSISDETFYPASQVTKQEQDGIEFYISTTSGSRVEWQEEENYKFRLSMFQSSLISHYTAHPNAIQPPQFQSDIMNALQEPLDDLSISRKRSRLSWGIPVPDDPDHTIYVWIDALTTYLSSVGYPWSATGGDGHSSGWPPDIQVIGKDILRFHAIYFPAMLQALDLPLAKQLLTHSHWTVERAKMSKSIGNVADPIQAIDKYGVDLVRYYLARVGGRFRDDVDWSQEQLQKHSKEVISLLGNLFLRTTSPKIMARVESVPRPSAADVTDTGTVALSPLLNVLKRLAPTFDQHMQRFQVADAMESIIIALSEANLLMTLAAPWSKDTPPAVAANIQALMFETLRQCGILLQPVMPEKSTLLLESLGVSVGQRTLADAAFGRPGLGERGYAQYSTLSDDVTMRSQVESFAAESEAAYGPRTGVPGRQPNVFKFRLKFLLYRMPSCRRQTALHDGEPLVTDATNLL